MICKECGAPLAERDTVCPRCGAAVPAREGGVGFWDMLEGPAAASDAPRARAQGEPTPTVRTTRLPEEERPVTTTPTPEPTSTPRTFVSLPLLACCALSLASLIAAAVMGSRAHARIQALEEQVTTLAASTHATQEQTETLANQMGQLGEAVRQLANGEAFAAVAYHERVSAPAGYQSEEGEYLFMVSAPTHAYTYTWQRVAADGSVEELAFDAKGVDARYGLSLQESADKTSSSLVATGLTSEAMGTYRCVVTSIFGEELTCTFELVESTTGRTTYSNVPHPVSASDADVVTIDGTDYGSEEPDVTTEDEPAIEDGATEAGGGALADEGAEVDEPTAEDETSAYGAEG